MQVMQHDVSAYSAAYNVSLSACIADCSILNEQTAKYLNPSAALLECVIEERLKKWLLA